MAIELSEDIITEKVAKHGSEGVVLTAGQWIHYESGDPASPVLLFLAQVPAGKVWKLTANVYIEETDA